MERAEVLDQLKTIITKTDSTFSIIPGKRCWFDGQDCNYGLPQGQFRNRPRAFCHTKNKGGCAKLRGDNLGELETFMDESIGQYVEAIFDNQGVALSNEVLTVAQEIDSHDNPEQRDTLILASEIIVSHFKEACGGEPKILREDFFQNKK